MALIWSYHDRQADKHYEIRSAGSFLRLYTNGAFHSQYSPKHLFTGGVWDLLSLPCLFENRTIKNRILMLGVGGGAAVHQLNRLLRPNRITGVELDPIHILVAKKYFGLIADNINLIEADAFEWLRRSRAKFDVVIDDVFVDAPGDPLRPYEVDDRWLTEIIKKLRPTGIIIQNHLEKKSATQVALAVRDRFSSALLFHVPHYENVVLALYQQPVNARSGRHLAMRMIENFESKTKSKLRFSVRQVY